MKGKRVWYAALLLALCVGLLPVSVLAEDTVYEVSDATGFADAITRINESGSGTIKLIWGFTDFFTVYELRAKATIDLNGYTLQANLNILSGADITITDNGSGGSLVGGVKYDPDIWRRQAYIRLEQRL